MDTAWLLYVVVVLLGDIAFAAIIIGRIYMLRTDRVFLEYIAIIYARMVLYGKEVEWDELCTIYLKKAKELNIVGHDLGPNEIPRVLSMTRGLLNDLSGVNTENVHWLLKFTKRSVPLAEVEESGVLSCIVLNACIVLFLVGGAALLGENVLRIVLFGLVFIVCLLLASAFTGGLNSGLLLVLFVPYPIVSLSKIFIEILSAFGFGKIGSSVQSIDFGVAVLAMIFMGVFSVLFSVLARTDLLDYRRLVEANDYERQRFFRDHPKTEAEII